MIKDKIGGVRGGFKVVQQSRIVVRLGPILDRDTVYVLLDPLHHDKCYCSMQDGLYSVPHATAGRPEHQLLLISVESVCTCESSRRQYDVSFKLALDFLFFFPTGVHCIANHPPQIQGLERWIVVGGVWWHHLFWVHAGAFVTASFLFRNTNKMQRPISHP